METEDEQVEKIKAWFKENGMSIVFGVVIGVGGIGGYKYYQHWQETTAAEASRHYSEVMEALAAGDHQQVLAASETLSGSYAGTEYARLALLAVARSHVDNAAYGEAESVLADLADAAADTPIGYIARSRLAAVQLQNGKIDAALSTLSVEFPDEFAARVDELRGDALALQGKSAEAAEAYRRARSAELQPANIEFLQQKIDALGVSS